METGICAGTIYRALDAESRIVLGDIQTQLPDFTEIYTSAEKDIIEEILGKRQVHRFSQ